MTATPMTSTPTPTATPAPARQAPLLLGTALALGVAADQLFRVPAWGLNLAVFVVWLAVWAGQFAARDKDRLDRSPWPLLAACFFALMWAVRDAEMLLAWNVLAALGLLSLPLVQARGLRLREAGTIETLLGPARAGWNAFVGMIVVLFRDMRWLDLLGQSRLRRAGAAVAGVVLALPFLLVFGALFASADPMFRAALQWMFIWDPTVIVRHAVPIGAVAWVSAGYLRAVAQPARDLKNPFGHLVPEITMGFVPVATALGAMVLLFTLFVAVQTGSLFRGESFVLSHTGLTFAEYARGGFFQLVAASALALPVVYGAPWVAALAGAGAAAREVRSLRALQAAQLGLVALVAVSALWRMSVYIRAYGLTEDRLYGAAIIVWIGAMIAVFARTILVGRPQSAALGATAAAALVLGLLNLANPDALIARYNLDRATGRLDVEHLLTLHADATPVIVSRLGALDDASRCALATGLASRWRDAPAGDWRSWNLARARARRLLPTIERAAADCPPVSATPSQARRSVT